MNVRGNKSGKENTIAGFKQGGLFVVPTFRADRNEVKTPSKGTTSHKSKAYLVQNCDSESKVKKGANN